VYSRCLRCLFVSNKPDLVFPLLFLVFTGAAMVVASKFTGAEEWAGSEALFKGSPWWMVEKGGCAEPGTVSSSFFGFPLASVEMGRWILKEMRGRTWTSGSLGTLASGGGSLEALIWQRTSIFSLAVEAIAGMDEKQRGGAILFTAVGDEAHHRQGIRRSDGARCGGRWPTSSVKLSILMAEGRPIFFLPAMSPDGRQSGFSLESVAWSHGDLAAPSGAVPGDGEVHPDRKLLGTQLHSSFTFKGPFCINHGLGCNLGFCLGLAVRCFVSLFSI
jgi:hypothetical protein